MAGLDTFKELEEDTKRLDHNQKVQVTVFWDIENVRPVKNTSIIDIVNDVRSRYVVGGVEAGFIVVCDVRKEPKDLVDQLTEAQCQVQHISGDKKNTSDDVLKQEMRRTVDMSREPGRIVLISGDSDFTDHLHGFRYRRGFEIILIHNNQAKASLIKIANTAIPFSQLIGGVMAIEKQKQVPKKEEKPKKEIQQISLDLYGRPIHIAPDCGLPGMGTSSNPPANIENLSSGVLLCTNTFQSLSFSPTVITNGRVLPPWGIHSHISKGGSSIGIRCATNGGIRGATRGGTRGATRGGTRGATRGGTRGATRGSTRGGTSGAIRGGITVGSKGGIKIGTKSGTSGTTKGGTSGTTKGGTSGTTKSGTSGTTKNGTRGGTRGARGAKGGRGKK